MFSEFKKGTILHDVIRLSIPLIIINVLSTLYQIIDAFWVGQLGTDAVAAVALSFPILFVIISVAMGFTVAGRILVSQYKGKGDTKKINHVATQTFVLMIIISLIVSIIGYFIAPSIIGLINTKPSIAVEATNYLQVALLGLFFLFPYYLFQAFHRGVGEVKIPLYITLFALLLNFILDPIFINGFMINDVLIIPAFGVVGSAIVTIFAQGIAAIIGIFIMLKGSYGIKLDFGELNPIDYGLLRKMFSIAIPSSIQFTTNSLSMVVMVFFVSMFNVSTISAYGIGVNIMNFVMLPVMGIAFASSILVGQNVGASKIKQAFNIAKKSIILSVVVLLITGVILFMFSNVIINMFIKSVTPEDYETVRLGVEFLSYLIITFCLMGPLQVIMSSFMGAGQTKLSLIISLLVTWGLRIPLAYILSIYLGVSGVWLSFPVSAFISLIIALIIFYKYDWVKQVI